MIALPNLRPIFSLWNKWGDQSNCRTQANDPSNLLQVTTTTFERIRQIPFNGWVCNSSASVSTWCVSSVTIPAGLIFIASSSDVTDFGVQIYRIVDSIDTVLYRYFARYPHIRTLHVRILHAVFASNPAHSLIYSLSSSLLSQESVRRLVETDKQNSASSACHYHADAVELPFFSSTR